MKNILKKYLNEDSKYYRPLTIVLFILTCIIAYLILYFIGYFGDYYGNQIYFRVNNSSEYFALPLFGFAIVLTLVGVFLMLRGIYNSFCEKLKEIIN